MQKDIIIRSLDDENSEDYRALAALYGYAYPEERTTPIELKLYDRIRDAKLVCERQFAIHNGCIAGVGCFEHQEDFYHPNKYLLHIIIAPSFQKQNIGRALYLDTINNLEKLNPVEVQCRVRSDRERSVRFAEACGFERTALRWNLVLDLNSFNPKSLTEQLNRVRDLGIEIKLFSDLDDDSDRDRKFYDLYVKTVMSIKSAGDPNIPSFEEFIIKKDQNAFEMTFIAVHKDKYAGMWQMETGTGTSLFGGAMGVDESYRQSGISYALAVHGIIHARKCRYDTVTAHTDEHNRAVLRLTEKLGFIRRPAQYLYSKMYETE